MGGQSDTPINQIGRLSVRSDDDVFGSDISMDDPNAMRVLERRSDLAKPRLNLRDVDRAFVLKNLAQSAAVDELTNDQKLVRPNTTS